jgi:hypothetical protein
MQLLTEEFRCRSVISFLPARVGDGSDGERTMRDESAGAAVGRRSLQELLLRYLRDAHAPVWPGADALTVQEVLHSYAENAAAGRVPDQQQLQRLHPELQEAVVSFFADNNRHRERPER